MALEMLLEVSVWCSIKQPVLPQLLDDHLSCTFIMKLSKAYLVLSFAFRDVLSAPFNRGISVDIDLSPYFNNKGVSTLPGGANFDGNNGSYPLNQLPTGILPYLGVNVRLTSTFKPTDNRSQGSISVHASTMEIFITGQCPCKRAERSSDGWTFSVAPSFRSR